MRFSSNRKATERSGGAGVAHRASPVKRTVTVQPKLTPRCRALAVADLRTRAGQALTMAMQAKVLPDRELYLEVACILHERAGVLEKQGGMESSRRTAARLP